MINSIFDCCVQLLLWLGGKFGMSYEAINVWVFCVVWPIFTAFLIITIFRQRRMIRILTKQQP